MTEWKYLTPHAKQLDERNGEIVNGVTGNGTVPKRRNGTTQKPNANGGH